MNKASKTDYMNATKMEVGKKGIRCLGRRQVAVLIIGCCVNSTSVTSYPCSTGKAIDEPLVKRGTEQEPEKRAIAGFKHISRSLWHHLENLRSQRGAHFFFLTEEILYHRWARVEDSGLQEERSCIKKNIPYLLKL